MRLLLVGRLERRRDGEFEGNSLYTSIRWMDGWMGCATEYIIFLLSVRGMLNRDLDDSYMLSSRVINTQTSASKES